MGGGVRTSLLVVFLISCVGEIGAPVAPPQRREEERVDCSLVPPDPGRASMRRLSRLEYDHTVRDLLGDTSQPASDMPPDEGLHGFERPGPMTAVVLQRLERVASRLAADAVRRPGVLPVCAREDLALCARAFVQTFGRRAFRRPLDDKEVTTLLHLYETERAAGETFEASLELVITAVLQSPAFLYRIERGDPEGATDDGLVPLTGWEVASRLSYFLWSSMPDDALLDAADRGELDDAEGVAAVARAMLEDPRAQEATDGFFDQWLGLEQLDTMSKAAAYPDFLAPTLLGGSLHEATLAFTRRVMWEDDARLETLLTARYGYRDALMASVYGQRGDEAGWVTVEDGDRAGLLTDPGILSIHANPDQSSPILRGKFVREQLMCQPLPSPPETDAEGDPLNIVAPEVSDTQTTRERFAAHTASPGCAGCHRLMDPIGFGLEGFDGMGRPRRTETVDGREQPIDLSGVIADTARGDVEFTGAAELGHLLAVSTEARDCAVNQWFRYAFGRVETRADICSLGELAASFDASDRDLRELIVAITTTAAFRFLRPEPEGSP